jgi:mycothiol synthase
VTLEVVRAESDDELCEVVAVRAAVHPELEGTIEGIRHQQRAFPGSAAFLARIDGLAVGAGLCFKAAGLDDDAMGFADVCVLAGYRRRGVGTALARAVSAHGRSLGLERLFVEAREDTPEASAFVERRGFVEVERQKALALDLGETDLPEPAPPEGVRIVTRAERPDVERDLYALSLAASADIPGPDADYQPTFEQWRAIEIERPSRRAELMFVAFAGDEVVGYAGLEAYGRVASHGLTTVRRDWCRRGVARALKLSQLHAARAAGFERVVTESEERNEPMRRLNESLGFQPIPGTIGYRGPLPD